MGENIPRSEYPRPQMVRDEWMCLNGKWQFEMDFGNSGIERQLYAEKNLSGEIIVPFCPESELSGVGYTDFIPAVWYKKTIILPDKWNEKRVILHFGAVDYETVVWVNGIEAGRHKGGYINFSFDITKLLKDGENDIVVNAVDDLRSQKQPGGKQSHLYHSHGCSYTRTTGIWQSVWLEAVNDTYIKGFKLIPDAKNGSVSIEAEIDGDWQDVEITASASFDGKAMGSSSAMCKGWGQTVGIVLSESHLWGAGSPKLYDLTITLNRGSDIIDKVTGYFGLRDVSIADGAILLNGEKVYQRLVLDQGFYPDGIYTAPTDEALKYDIEISMGLGFNGARLHEKIFEPRFLYWADKLGYLVWGEHANWGLDVDDAQGLLSFLPEWMECLKRDFNHPAIVGWCPFNETNVQQEDEVIRTVYNVTKLYDSTRPVIDTSGYIHVQTDIWDSHNYCQVVEEFAEMFAGEKLHNNFPGRQEYRGEPYFCSEYGGIRWTDDETGWGYGKGPATKEEFIERYRGLTDVLLDDPRMCAFCYTQLYDIEQEQNGLYTYDRKPKFDPEIFYKINTKKAAIED